MTLVVVAMYLATSTTALAHRLSHAPAPLAPDALEKLGGIAGALDCLFCAHAPGVALVSSPSPLRAPSAIFPVLTVSVRTAPPGSGIAHSPQLRAPPFAS